MLRGRDIDRWVERAQLVILRGVIIMRHVRTAPMDFESLLKRVFGSGRKPLPGFDQEKSAQMCAYFLQRATGSTDKLKLIKLIYLSEREYLDRYLMPMTLDEFYSMKNGPIASCALNGINGELDADLWSEWLVLDGNEASPAKQRQRNEFNKLSEADITVMDAVWGKFGTWSTSKIWKFVHSEIPEYEEIPSGRRPISYSAILTALKKDAAEDIARDISTLKQSLKRLEA